MENRWGNNGNSDRLYFHGLQNHCRLINYDCSHEIERHVLLGRNVMTKLVQFSSVQFSRSVMSDSATPWTAVCQASLSITNSRNLLKLMSIELVMLSNYLILCCSLLLQPSVFPSIRVFSNESALCIKWPKYWRFTFNITPSNEYLGFISFRMD